MLWRSPSSLEVQLLSDEHTRINTYQYMMMGRIVDDFIGILVRMVYRAATIYERLGVMLSNVGILAELTVLPPFLKT